MATTNSYFGQLFLDLCDYLKTAVPELKWIDQDFGQLELFEDRPTVSFPCCLIDFPMATFSNVSGNAQIGDITVQLRMGFAPFDKSYHLAPDVVRQKALEYYAIEQKVYEKLQGWEKDYTQPFSRINSGTEQRMSASDLADKTGIRVRVMNFATGFNDDSALPSYTKAPATLEIQISEPPVEEEEPEENP
jgi:hypothetical protein